MFLNAKCKGLKLALDASGLHTACCHARLRSGARGGLLSPGLGLLCFFWSFPSTLCSQRLQWCWIAFSLQGALTPLIDIFGLPGRSLQGQKGTHRKSIRPHITSLQG